MEERRQKLVRAQCQAELEDLKRIREAGLVRIHVGLESGCDDVLKFIRKGVTAADHIEGGQRLVAAGISLCEYVMPGLGGQRWSREHAIETARVLNAINPDHIRLRTLSVRRGTALYEMMQQGEFQPIGDEEILKEISLFIGHLDGIESPRVDFLVLPVAQTLDVLREDRLVHEAPVREESPSGGKDAKEKEKHADDNTKVINLVKSIEKAAEENTYSHDGEEFLFILDGTAELILDNERITLDEGDCVYFDSSLKHRLLSKDGSEVRVLAVVTR